MLEGLEITVLALSATLTRNDVFRVDAEYFGKEPLRALRRLQAIDSVPLGAIAFVTDGIHTSLPFREDGEVKILSAKHPKENYVDRSGFETVSRKFHEANPRTALQIDDVLISTVGTIGNSAVVTPDLLPANSDRHIGIIRLNKGAMSPYYLSTFLLGKYGRVQSGREVTGNVQPNLFISKINKLLVPRFSNSFENSVSDTVVKAYAGRAYASQIFMDTEGLLARALCVENWLAPEPLTYVRSSIEAFSAARLDAEYFYPAKQAAQSILLNASSVTVGDHFESIRELWQPDDDESEGEVRNYDLNDALVPFLEGEKPSTPRNLIASTKKRLHEGDLVVSRLRSYLKEIAIVESGGELPMVASTEFIVLRPRRHDSLPVEALMIYLRSALPQLIFKWSQDGSNHPRFDERELLRMPIPHAVLANVDEYVKSVRAIQKARKRAAELLEAAKRAVEIAIEDSEAAALAYLDKVASLTH